MGMSRATPPEHDSVEFRMSPRDPGQARRWLLVRGGDLAPRPPGPAAPAPLRAGDQLRPPQWRRSRRSRRDRPGAVERRLEIVEAGADRWGIEGSGPTTVWFELDVA